MMLKKQVRWGGGLHVIDAYWSGRGDSNARSPALKAGDFSNVAGPIPAVADQQSLYRQHWQARASRHYPAAASDPHPPPAL